MQSELNLLKRQLQSLYSPSVEMSGRAIVWQPKKDEAFYTEKEMINKIVKCILDGHNQSEVISMIADTELESLCQNMTGIDEKYQTVVHIIGKIRSIYINA